MTTIASLGLQIDSGDAVEAKDNLDQLTDAGKRSEESAGRTGRAWETALGSLQGDTRQIVQELQSLNAKQAELAQQMATVGRAVTSASTAFSSAAANMGAFRDRGRAGGQGAGGAHQCHGCREPRPAGALPNLLTSSKPEFWPWPRPRLRQASTSSR